MSAITIEKEALHLPASNRAELAHKLLESLDEREAEIDPLWLSEAERRLTELQSGLVPAISSQQFQADAQALFR